MPLKKGDVKSSLKKPLKKGDVKSSSKKQLKKGGVKSSSKKPLKKEGAKSAPAKISLATKPVTTKSALSVIHDKLKPPEKSTGVFALANRLQNAPQSALSFIYRHRTPFIYRHRTPPENPLKKEGAKSAPAKISLAKPVTTKSALSVISRLNPQENQQSALSAIYSHQNPPSAKTVNGPSKKLLSLIRRLKRPRYHLINNPQNSQ